MAIPQEKEIIQPLLRLLIDEQEHNSDEMFDTLSAHFSLTQEERSARSASGAHNQFKNNIAWALALLNQYSCVEKIAKGRYRITPLGIKAYPLLPQIVERGVLTNALGSVSEQFIIESEKNEEAMTPGMVFSFPLEAHLRDFIARNIESIDFGHGPLMLYGGPEGIEYRTGVGPIDILATDEKGNLIIFELKLSRGQDQTLGQIARYMGWIAKHLAHGKDVLGVIVVSSASESLKYAVSIMPKVNVFEYSIAFTISPVLVQD